MFWNEIVRDFFSYHADKPLLFNSVTFWVWFIMVLSVYAFIYQHNLARTLFLLAFSLYFYYKSSGWFVLNLIFTILLSYYLTYWMYKAKNKTFKKILFILNVSIPLLILGYYKYYNFFLDNLSALTGRTFTYADVILPVGISFYTFQILSYVIDVYRGVISPEGNLLDFAFYVTFFPQLVAGPIVRASLFLPQLKKTITLDEFEIQRGFFLIIQGLIKKAIIADYIAQYNDIVFSNPAGYSGFENLMALYGYALQIYCDFSGYSDMAIGIGKIMGFDLGINFNKPYQALNITDFWRRWHISLSSWLRDYLYIPLGGNRKGKIRTYINLFITMLLGGLWHGASWRFVIWGGMHGIGLAIHKIWKKIIPEKFSENKIWKIFAWIITFHFVVFLWIFFRASTMQDAWAMIKQIFTAMDPAYILPFWQVRKLFLLLLLVGFAIHFIPTQFYPTLEKWFIRIPWVVKAIGFIVLVQLIIELKSQGVQPFIYFQF
jgi:D-alanyl-lipoteichoic acid acyltransferase DltB (MBOAT superfamily)